MSKRNWKLALVLSYLMYLNCGLGSSAKTSKPTLLTPAKPTLKSKSTNTAAKSTTSTTKSTGTTAKSTASTTKSTIPAAKPTASTTKSAIPATKSTAPATSAATTSSSTPTTAKADEKAEDLKPVLDPGQFFGMAAMGYASAKACPHVCSKVFCYCGCDITDSHTNLLDCFTGMHGVDCHICQEEAMQALSMHREGKSISDIQKAIDLNYAGKYPFETESPALKKYKSLRLWSQGLNKVTTGEKSGPKEDTCCSGSDKPKK